MQPAEAVLLEIDDAVAVVTLNEPERRNPLSPRIIEGLTATLRGLADDPACRVVVLRGAGRGFCAGADLGRMRTASPLEDRDEYNTQLELNRTLWGYPKPTISAVHGFALGAGCNLMNWCDISIVEEDARLGFPEVVAGVPLGASLPTLLRTVGRKLTLEFALTGQHIDPQRALAVGLVNRVVGKGRAFETALDMARLIAGHDARAIRLTKEVVRSVSEMNYEQGIEHAKEVRVIARLAPDFGVHVPQGGGSDADTIVGTER